MLGKQELQTLLSKDRAKQMSLIQEGVNNEAENFGIKIVDVRIKRADLPQANSEAIFKRMQTEREREAKEFRILTKGFSKNSVSFTVSFSFHDLRFFLCIR